MMKYWIGTIWTALLSVGLLSPALAAETVTTTEQLKMRVMRDPNSRVVGMIPKGKGLSVSDCKQGWCATIWNGRNGFVIEALISRDTDDDIVMPYAPLARSESPVDFARRLYKEDGAEIIERANNQKWFADRLVKLLNKDKTSEKSGHSRRLDYDVLMGGQDGPPEGTKFDFSSPASPEALTATVTVAYKFGPNDVKVILDIARSAPDSSWKITDIRSGTMVLSKILGG